MDNADLQQDSGRYLQEYIQSLENLPSEIKYHWAEIQSKNEQTEGLEQRILSQQHNLTRMHKQWFQQEQDKRQKIQRHEPNIIRRIHRDYEALEGLATERIQLVEGALNLVDRHLSRLGHDLDEYDRNNPSQAPPPRAPVPRLVSHDSDLDEDEDEAYFESLMAAQQRKRKKRDASTSSSEPLYCYCQQVSFGEMVGCDGENCPYEWFHMKCVGLDAPPKGAWYCEECLAELQQRTSVRKKEPTSSATSSQSVKKLKRKKDSTTSS